MKRFLAGIVLVSVAIAFFACNKSNSLEDLRKAELVRLDEFIQKNYPNEKQLPSGLYYIETLKGEGDTILPGDKVLIFYATWTIDSVLIDQTSGYMDGHRFEPFEYVVGSGTAISGLEEASLYMQPGTKSNLVIPSELAYGQNGDGTGAVGGFKTLLMEVEVYKVYPYPVTEE